VNLTILSSRHSDKTAVALGKELDCSVLNPYNNKWYHHTIEPSERPFYNMGCSGYNLDTTFNNEQQISTCINKVATFNLLQSTGTLYVPWTSDQEQAQAWLDEDRIIVNRATIIGACNEGVSYSSKSAPNMDDVPLNLDSIIWTRYVNHTREIRAYCIEGTRPLVFHKVDKGGHWEFKQIIHIPLALQTELNKAMQAFDKMFCIAFDILECVTGDYYFLEANSAPSLLVHPILVPTLAQAIKEKLQ